MRLLRRGDLVLVDFTPAREGEANFVRPAVVVTHNTANLHSPVVVVVPLTSNVERVYPFELLLPLERTGLDRDSKAQPQLVRHVTTGRLRRTLGQLPDDLLIELDRRLASHLGLQAPS